MKIRVSVSTDRIGSKCEKEIELDDRDFEGMDENEINEYIFERFVGEMINWSYEVIE